MGRRLRVIIRRLRWRGRRCWWRRRGWRTIRIGSLRRGCRGGGEGIADNYAVEFDEVKGSDYGVLFREHARSMAAKDGKGDGKGYDKEGGEGG